MFRAPCAHRQEVKIVLYSLWYHHTETSEWSEITKITKIQFYKYEHIVVKFMCEYFGCDYCVLFTRNMLWHVEVMFNWLNIMTLYMFRTVFRSSSAVQDCTYSNRHMSNRYWCLLASKQSAVSVWLLYVQSWTADDGQKDRPKHVECHSKMK